MSSQNVLLVGGGGREHALAWKLLQSPRLGKLYVAPGNGGTQQIAQNVDIKATDIDGLLNFAAANNVSLTVVGQDDPLALGIVDAFQARDLKIFGPTKAAARIEASKVFAKKLMSRGLIPTATYKTFGDYQKARQSIDKHFSYSEESIVIKASGLALGKGAYICENRGKAREVLYDIMQNRVHGEAGNEVVIEQFIRGQEVSMHAFCDGEAFSLFPSAQDHKPIFDGNLGPNTGGMGAIAPVPWFKRQAFVSDQIVLPILWELARERSPFTGVLYPGLKMADSGPIVLEFNARFGDPETQAYMRLLKTDLLDIIEACVEGRLREVKVEWYHGFAVCVVLASAGYPGECRKGLPITGINFAQNVPNVHVFHAGTKQVDGQLVTAGGRVVGVTATGLTLKEALAWAYMGISCLQFEGMQYRTDIGAKSLKV